MTWFSENMSWFAPTMVATFVSVTSSFTYAVWWAARNLVQKIDLDVAVKGLNEKLDMYHASIEGRFNALEQRINAEKIESATRVLERTRTRSEIYDPVPELGHR
jgi:hypothetical protein